MYKVGDRLDFIWRGKWRGITPGTVTKVTKKTITVDWDDNTTTKSSIEFINRSTRRPSERKKNNKLKS